MANDLKDPLEKSLNPGDLHAIELASGKASKNKSTADDSEKAQWDASKVTPAAGQIDKSRLQAALKLAREKGAILGIVSVLGIGGAVAGSFLGPAGMLLSVMENFIDSNDTTSTSLQSRFMRTFGNMTSGDVICANSSKSIRCKSGQISNKALTQLSKKGVTAYDKNGTPIELDGGKGYPGSNPSSYSFDLGDGKMSDPIAAKDVPEFLSKKENSKLASKVLGTKGAFNLKLKAWSGKYITNKVFKNYGVNKKGGNADGSGDSKDAESAHKKLKSKIPGLEKLKGIKASIDLKVGKHMGAAKKGGVAYTIAVASCIAVKAPGYIAAGVAAIQLAQVMPFAVNMILSPGSKLKAAGVDPAASDFKAEDMEGIGNALTERTEEADGKSYSALDSPILLSAMGINSGKPEVSKDYTPGYSILTDPIVIAANQIDKATAPACNVLMSPASMYTAMVASAAVTVALAPTIVGGIAKVIADLAGSEIAGEVVKNVVGDKAVEIVTSLATNSLVPDARGRDFGDVLGISATAFFSSGGMARNLPTLTTDQVPEFAALQQKNDDFERDMDIASLSPFDTSSRYTFMGSIVYNMRMAALTNGTYTNDFMSLVSTIGRLPLSGLSFLSNNSYAAAKVASCGYADDFGLNTDDSARTPAVNVAGLPCTGLTEQMASMSTSQAIDLVASEGWIDESIAVKDGATIDELVSSGVIKPDTPLADYITSCGNASSGDYLFNTASCTIDTSAGDLNASTAQVEAGGVTPSCDSDTTDCVSDTTSVKTLSSGDSMAAIPVFLADFQLAQGINGEDDIKGENVLTAFDIPEDNSEVAAVEETETPQLTLPAPIENSVKEVAFNNPVQDSLLAYTVANKQWFAATKRGALVG